MKIAVIYHSDTGFTKRYGQWIAEATKADLFSLSDAKQVDFNVYDAIVFGSWACAGGIRKLNWFKNHLKQWEGKRLIAFCVGANPYENPDVQEALKQNFPVKDFANVNVFYCPGGLNYEEMPPTSKVMMKMFVSMLKKKKQRDEDMIRWLSSSYDITDKKYIEPICKLLKEE